MKESDIKVATGLKSPIIARLGCSHSCAANPVIPEPLFETASTGLDFCVTFQASKLYRAIEKYRALNNASVVDYRKVLAQMDKLTEGYESDVRINVSKNTDDVRINVRLSDENQSSAGSEDLVYSRKKHIIELLKVNPEATVEKLQSELSVTDRTIYRDIEWLRENGYLERLGSKKSGSWHVIKELE